MSRTIRIAVALSGAMLAAPAFADTPAQKGKSIYAASCASCHGADGKGDGPSGMYFSPSPTDFTTAAFAKQPDASVREAIVKGKGNMPAFASKLSDAAIDEVVAYLRTLAPKPKPAKKPHRSHARAKKK